LHECKIHNAEVGLNLVSVMLMLLHHCNIYVRMHKYCHKSKNQVSSKQERSNLAG
jgi:hypothetical protein